MSGFFLDVAVLIFARNSGEFDAGRKPERVRFAKCNETHPVLAQNAMQNGNNL
jgi:hypothetical protein